MNQTDLLKILESVRGGKLSPSAALERLKHLPFEDLGFAKVDHHRALRQGFAEVVFAEGKTPQQVAGIVIAVLALIWAIFIRKREDESSRRYSYPRVGHVSGDAISKHDEAAPHRKRRRKRRRRHANGEALTS